MQFVYKHKNVESKRVGMDVVLQKMEVVIQNPSIKKYNKLRMKFRLGRRKKLRKNTLTKYIRWLFIFVRDNLFIFIGNVLIEQNVRTSL